MRALSLALLFALACSASAQTDARLYGAWVMSPNAPPPEMEGAPEDARIVSVWIEFGTDGRSYGQSVLAAYGDEQTFTTTGTYHLEGSMLHSEPGTPSEIAFLASGDVRLSDGLLTLVLQRARAPILALDILGSWRALGGSDETVSFSITDFDGARVAFVGSAGLVDHGTWHIDARGLTVETPGMGAVTYTGLSRDGDQITLTGGGEPLTLQPLATE